MKEDRSKNRVTVTNLRITKSSSRWFVEVRRNCTSNITIIGENNNIFKSNSAFTERTQSSWFLVDLWTDIHLVNVSEIATMLSYCQNSFVQCCGSEMIFIPIPNTGFSVICLKNRLFSKFMWIYFWSAWRRGSCIGQGTGPHPPAYRCMQVCSFMHQSVPLCTLQFAVDF